METAVIDHDWNETSEWSWVENETEVIHAVLDALKPETPATDRIVAGIKADGVEEWVSSRGGRWNGTTEEALIEVVNRRAAMLAAAPQPPGSEPATVPGKWVPVSEQKPDCWCLTCRPVVLNDMRFVVCPDCGNKRCPRANDHRNACTGSNEPGQEGNAYPDTPQEVKP